MDNAMFQTLLLMALLVVSTLVSEDLTCIGAGVMVTQGRIGFLPGALACFLGIYVGDLLLFVAGRTLGRSALKRAPLKWFVRDRDVQKSSDWFSQKGILVIGASRFLPGARLPTYFAAGLLKTSFWRFALYFLLAAAVWTPILVGLSILLGPEVVGSALLANQHLAIRLVVAVFILFVSARFLISLASYRGRRLLVSRWRRLTRWEFWPPWVFYLPVVVYSFLLVLKYRSLSVFTAANPTIPGGGFIGESKTEILRGLSTPGGFIARASSIRASLSMEARVDKAKRFMTENHLVYPVVLKPDMGQRGSGVAVVRSDVELEDYLRRLTLDTIIQEYVAGCEFGVFYYRYPGSEKGRIFSVTEKQFPVVVGDGVNTLERLILKDERAVCMARFFLEKHRRRLGDVPADGERVQLVELGTHCRGAIFLDGSWVKTEALEEAIDQISRRFEGFYFGRFDIRTPSLVEFKQGKNFKVIELNGVTSEATQIYDPKNSLFTAYRVLFDQWRIAYEIGAQNRERGVKPTSLRNLAKMVLDYRRQANSQSNSANVPNDVTTQILSD